MTDFIFDRIDEVEENWTSSKPAEYLYLDAYSYLELTSALGYEEGKREIERYHGYKIVVVAQEEPLIELH